jgi:hypothetical protein
MVVGVSDNYDNMREHHARVAPDQDQRLERPSHDFERPRLMRPWVAVAVLVAVLAAFVLLVMLDSGSSNNPAPPLDGESIGLVEAGRR